VEVAALIIASARHHLEERVSFEKKVMTVIVISHLVHEILIT